MPLACGLIESGAARTRACRLCWSGCWLCCFPRSRSLLTPNRGMSLRETLHAFPGPLKTEYRSDTLEEGRGGVDLHCGVLGALCHSLTIHVNACEHDAYSGHRHSSSLVRGRCGDIRSRAPAQLLDLVHAAFANHGGCVGGMLCSSHSQHTPHVAPAIRAARGLDGWCCLCCSEGFSSAFCG